MPFNSGNEGSQRFGMLVDDVASTIRPGEIAREERRLRVYEEAPYIRPVPRCNIYAKPYPGGKDVVRRGIHQAHHGRGGTERRRVGPLVPVTTAAITDIMLPPLAHGLQLALRLRSVKWGDSALHKITPLGRRRRSADVGQMSLRGVGLLHRIFGGNLGEGPGKACSSVTSNHFIINKSITSNRLKTRG